MAVSAWSAVDSATTGNAYTSAPRDVVVLADAPSRSAAYGRGEQRYALTDTTLVGSQFVRAVLNDMAISDLIVRQLTGARTLSDLATLADAIAANRGSAVGLSDAEDLSTSAILELEYGRVLVDAETLDDGLLVVRAPFIPHVSVKYPGRELLVYRENQLIGQLLSISPIGSARKVRNVTRYGAAMTNYKLGAKQGEEIELVMAAGLDDPEQDGFRADYLSRQPVDLQVQHPSAGWAIEINGVVVGVRSHSPLGGLYTTTARVRILSIT
jgi:hypothetical protein